MSPENKLSTYYSSNASGQIDQGKLIYLFRKHAWWVVLIIVLTNLAAHLYIRYTRPVYESESVVKLGVEKQANILGINALEQNLDNMAGEVELLKSDLFFTKVAEIARMDISYYARGRINFQERYQNSPFRVQYAIYDVGAYDRPFDIEILNDEQFVLSYEEESEVISRAYAFGEEISNPSFRFVVTLTEDYESPRDDTRYYFTVNSEKAVKGYLSRNMNVEPVNLKANTIRIGFQGYDRHKVRDLVAIMDSVYLEYTLEKKNEATEKQIVFLDEQLTTVEDRLGRYETYFEDFTIQNRTNDLRSEIGEAIMKLEALELKRFELTQMREAVTELEKQVENEEVVLAEPTMFSKYPSDVTTHIQELNKLINDRELLAGSYKEKTYAIQLKDQRIALLKKSILELLQSYQVSLGQEAEEIAKNREEIEKEFMRLPSRGTDYNRNQRYYALYEEIFLSLIQKKNELEIARAGTVTDFVVLLPATLPGTPVAPEVLLIRGAGGVTGVVLSVAFLLIAYVLHDKISSQSELERYTQVPVVGSIPKYRRAKSLPAVLVVNESSKLAVSEAFRTIRTNLQFMGLSDNRQVVSVTSTVSTEGKTFVATNLASIMAMSGRKTVLIDLDMRRPKIHFAFDADNSAKGMSTILIEKYTLDDCIRHSKIDNLDFISAGAIPPNPAELIGSQKFADTLEELKNRYDLVVIDTPPVGLVTDGTLVMEKADVPLYVVRADFSRKVFIKNIDRIQTTRKHENLSLILNSVDSVNEYGYAYEKYGQNYYTSEEPLPGIVERLKHIFGRS
ncbi:polysaccharide biosynthesis tyrosine autokinase [Tunicatimonas pelagia]|uniref:polysaccharide biosynthesis tyrosine autokinase n=1 Tax=Tunicatimonas pelagia TaxID=931531 RepID=UPI002665D91D|nr:polysaccharide biosynthesis tyrosine autokinase [Tunicatimonas pelagia]WKN45218.1 polysaccharide biosynthesis tyrosine autokinase [Tunicatimonas pelagia]